MLVLIKPIITVGLHSADGSQLANASSAGGFLERSRRLCHSAMRVRQAAERQILKRVVVRPIVLERQESPRPSQIWMSALGLERIALERRRLALTGNAPPIEPPSTQRLSYNSPL